MRGVDRRSFLAWLSSGAVAAATLGHGGSLASATEGTVPADGPGVDGVLVLRNATVFDGTGAAPAGRTTVVCAGGRIVAVGGAHELSVPEGARVVDCTGRFLIPGLWDLHTHSGEIVPTFPALQLVHGVTSVREMRGSTATHEVRERIERGELAGPRMVVASNTLDGPGSPVPGATVVDSGADADDAVRTARREGADLLKVYSFLRPGGHAAIAEHAARHGLPFSGHSPSLLPVQEVVRRGQHSIEHNYGMHLSTSADADDYFARLASMPDDPSDPDWWGAQASLLEREAFRTYLPGRAADLAGLLAEHGAFHVPTFAVETAYSRHPTHFLDDERAQERAHRWIPPDIRAEWDAYVSAWPEWSPERSETELAYLEARLELVNDLVAAGAPVGTGTDCGAAYVFPGVSTHDELAALVRAGLSPARALRAATSDAARCAGVSDTGEVRAGHRADLVVLDADPLTDIAHTREIHGVVAAGALYGPAERAALFDEIERAARVPSTTGVTAPVPHCCPVPVR